MKFGSLIKHLSVKIPTVDIQQAWFASFLIVLFHHTHILLEPSTNSTMAASKEGYHAAN
jgi:hypothetical protein